MEKPTNREPQMTMVDPSPPPENTPPEIVPPEITPQEVTPSHPTEVPPPRRDTVPLAGEIARPEPG
jgi:hypothetical protein